MPERNVELLETTMQFIKDHPERHDQGTYLARNAANPDDCGTANCFAGWALTLSMAQSESEKLADLTYRYWHQDAERRPEVDAHSGLNDVGLEAADRLGLTYPEASKMFGASVSLPVLELMVKDLTNGAALRSMYAYVEQVDPKDPALLWYDKDDDDEAAL
jgi:hypothetical protein